MKGRQCLRPGGGGVSVEHRDTVWGAEWVDHVMWGRGHVALVSAYKGMHKSM